MAEEASFEEKLTRYLYTATTDNVCKIVPTPSTPLFCKKTLVEIIGTEHTSSRHSLILQHILRAFRSGLADKFALFAVLALLLKMAATPIVRRSIYQQFEELLRDPVDLFTFLHLHHKAEGGWGSGLRRQLTAWYENQDSLSLLVAVSKVTGRGVWNHCDIIRHSKVRVKNPENAVILTYSIKGFKKTKAQYADKADAQNIIGYLEQLESIKNCQQPDQAVRILNENSFGPDQLSSNVMRYPQVWLALLPKMTLREIIRHLKTMTKLGLFATESEHYKLLKTKLTDRVQIASSGLQPVEVAQLLGNVRAAWAHPPTTKDNIKPHLQKVEVAITPGEGVADPDLFSLLDPDPT